MKKYGWIPQLPDQRDYKMSFDTPVKLPSIVDLRSQMPPIYDQGQLGSCTANGIGAAIGYEHMKQFGQDLMSSRLFIYYNERVIEHSIKSDAGAQIRDGLKVVNKYGVCPESEWEYDISKFKSKPPPKCYLDALKDRVVKYEQVKQNLNQMKICLSYEVPIIGGFAVYESFESKEVSETGEVPLPNYDEAQLGGHCVLIVGYDDHNNHFIVRNSWGTSWGDKGYCYMPYEYWTNPGLSSDFWQITLLSA